MLFEFDSAKSIANKQKHGIDFWEAQALWQDDYLLEISAHSVAEQRFGYIGKIDNTLWTAFVTLRNETIRIISVRRARENEKQEYEKIRNT
jgi:uncharacterized DUF497 family protein